MFCAHVRPLHVCYCCCSQASVQCVERGRLLAQLWLALRSMLLAALHDRHSARASEDAAHAAAAAAASEVSRLQQQQEDERVALRAISERHAAKAEAAKQELAQCQKKNDQVGLISMACCGLLGQCDALCVAIVLLCFSC